MRLTITVLFSLFLASSLISQTNLSGTISTDSTLTVLNSPYIVSGNLTISNGATVTVESNVEIRFVSGAKIYVKGALTADAATFTSSSDTLGGSPEKGDWGSIQIGDYYSSGSAVFTNCQLKYGGGRDNSIIYIYSGSLNSTGTLITKSYREGVRLRSGSAVFEGTDITDCATLGLIMFNGVTVNITNSNIQGCDWPIRYDGTAALTFNGLNDFSGNVHNGILLYSSSYNTMTLDTIDVPYVVNSNLTVNVNETLTIAPSNIIKIISGGIYVKGALKAVAGAGETITFTSYKDDNKYGDTNNDGSTSAPNQSDWYGINFENTSIDSLCELLNSEIWFAGRGNSAGVTTKNASPKIDSCYFFNNYFGAKFVGVSSPSFTNNQISSSKLVPVAMSVEASPVFNNNSFPASDNEYDAIGIISGTMLADGTLPKRDFTSIPNITYLLLGNVTVPSGVTLTIDPGVVIKSYNYSHRLIIQGKLIADGTAAEPIAFTSAKDDNFGNPRDTNKDGTTAVPAIGDWSGIIFENGSDPTSIIDNCKIQFASSYYYAYYINGIYVGNAALLLINSSPTISNTLFKDVQYGIYAFASSNPTINGCTFENSKMTPILMSVSAAPTFAGNTFTNTGLTALGIIGEHLPVSGTIMKRDVAGYTNITYVLIGDLWINSGATVTVDSGVVIKINNGGIYVEGGFNAAGTAAEEIVFSSVKDDNFGNPRDTNGDGNATAPAKRDWTTINFLGTSDDPASGLDYCRISYAGRNNKGAVYYKDAGSSLSNSIISDSYYGVVFEGSSTTNLDQVTIQNCLNDPIAMSLKSDPVFTNVTFTANGSSGIKILDQTLSSDATLIKRSVAGFANVAYIIDNLTISANAVLEVQKGVVIKFNNNYWYGIVVNGALKAVGSSSEKIIFTSLKDDSSGGDTNNDGNTSAPAKGNWRGLTFNSSNLDSLNKLKNCEVRYSGGRGGIYNYQWGAVRAFSASIDIDSAIIEQSSSSGLGVFGSSNAAIKNSQINNVSSTPITISMFANPTLLNNTSLNAGIMAIGVIPENYSVDAAVPVRNFASFSNITYYLYGKCRVNSGTNITIPAGVVFKGGSWEIYGSLTVQGSAADKIVFTDLRDDEYGNPMDSNGDGNSTKPSITGTKIKFFDVSDDANSSIENAVIRYADVAIHTDQASPTLNAIDFRNDNWGIYLTGVSTPALDSCNFENLKYAPIRTSLVSYPSSTTGNSISGTTYKAIGILENETLVQDVTLPKRNFGGINNIPYLFGNYTVASNAVLTINPGVVLKFFPAAKFTVKRGLLAQGGASADSTIVFTDIRDDFYGGDTNSDSSDTRPALDNKMWRGISFAEESLDPLCIIEHSVIQYAGYYYSNEIGAIVAVNASPTISYSTLKNNYFGVVAKGASNPTVNYCDIYHNFKKGINNVNQSFVINAENNWWGDNSGPAHSSNPGGRGDAVSDGVDFTPWLGIGALNPVMGDVSLNGSVQAFDASKIMKYVVDPAGADSLNILQRSVADVSANGTITAYDASLILQYAVGLISVFPAEIGASPAMPPMDLKTRQYLSLQKVNGVSITMNDFNVNRGDEFSVPVYIYNREGVTALQVELDINSELFELNGITKSGLLNGFNLNYSFNKSASKLIIAIAGTSPLDTDGELFVLNLKAAENAKGITNNKIYVDKFLANETDFTASAVSGSIKLTGKPVEYGLEQNYPNPFNPSTTIEYKIPDENVSVKLIIYDISGRTVRTMVNTNQNAGRYKVVWNGRNDYGSKVSSGIYIYRIIAGKYTAIKKLMLLK